MRKFFKIIFVAAATVLIAGYLIPERKAMPHLLLPMFIMVSSRLFRMYGEHSALQVPAILLKNSTGG